MLRFSGQFQADFLITSGWIEPLLVGGYAPFSAIYSIEELLTMSAMIKTDEDKRQRYYVVNVIYKQDNNVWTHLIISAIFAVLILKRHMANRQRISGSSSYKTISIL